MAYPLGWPTRPAPYYLIAGDIAVYLMDALTIQNLTKAGVPTVGWNKVNLQTSLLVSLGNQVEHPLNPVGHNILDPL